MRDVGFLDGGKCLVVIKPFEVPFVVSEHLVHSNAEFVRACRDRVSFGVHGNRSEGI